MEHTGRDLIVAPIMINSVRWACRNAWLPVLEIGLDVWLKDWPRSGLRVIGHLAMDTKLGACPQGIVWLAFNHLNCNYARIPAWDSGLDGAKKV